MAVTLNGSVSSTSSAANTNTLTVSHTVAAGSNRCLFACIQRAAGTPAAVTSVTYGGTGLTQVGDFTGAGGANVVRVSIYRLTAPAVGTADLVMTLAANNDEIAMGGICFDGVDQTSPTDAAVTNSAATSTAPTVDVTSAVDDMVIDCLAVNDNDGHTATGTQHYNLTVGGSSVFASQRKDGAASVTMNWGGAFFPWAIIAVNINAASAASSIAAIASGYLRYWNE